MTDEEDREHTAYHEAGHVVVGYRLGLDAFEVSIVPDDEKGTAGRHIQESADETPEEAKNQVLALLAGAEADRIAFGGMEPDGATADLDKAVSLAPVLAGCSLEELRKQCKIMVLEDRLAITAIATALVEYNQLAREEWETIIESIDANEDWREPLVRYQKRMASLRRSQ